jgi:hypothetical protein
MSEPHRPPAAASAATRPQTPKRLARPAITAAIAGLLVASNRWMGWAAGARLVQARDEAEYRRIALAAPGLPHRPMGNQHAELFALNWLVGVIHDALGAPIDIVFRTVTLALMVALVIVLWRILAHLRAGPATFAVCMGVVLLNAYSLRYYLLAIGYVTDVSFVLALALIVLGLLSERFWLVLAALLLATLARQSALPLAPALVLIFALLEPWRAGQPAARGLRCALLVIVPAAAFTALVAISAPFSVSATPGLRGLTVIGSLERLPRSLGALAEHLVRCSNPLFAVGALLIAALAAGGWRRITPPTWACLLLGAAVWLQALALNPGYSGHPERLAVLSLVPFTGALAVRLTELERAGHRLEGWRAGVIVGLLALGSLQYLYTWLGPSSAVQGGLLQLITAVGAGAIAYRGLSRGAAEPAPPPVAPMRGATGARTAL